ncbi:rRNA pseudouridine synthase [Caulobacter sp. CCUG 60055]|nr:rRNA pseudouridine synthase [Caulobacter sp. CCUG 60055]
MPWTRRYEEAEPQRINRWLAQAGVCSRREAEGLIGRGLVSVDGETVTDPGRKIASGQTLTLADDATQTLDASLSIVFHKPVGVVSSQPEHGQVPAVRLLTRAALWGDPGATVPTLESKLAPVGRLDMDSRGLLLLSEDGVVAKAVIGPDAALEKEYLVRVAGEITPRKLALLRLGLELDGRQLKPARVTDTGSGVLRFVLKEGRNRQIRRMCELVELTVVDLHRIRIGPIEIGALPEGKWRPLTTAEREALLAPPAAGPDDARQARLARAAARPRPTAAAGDKPKKRRAPKPAVPGEKSFFAGGPSAARGAKPARGEGRGSAGGKRPGPRPDGPAKPGGPRRGPRKP